MKCRNCGHDLDEGVRFCDKCGVPVDDISASPNISVKAKKKNRTVESIICFILLGLFLFGMSEWVDKLAGDDVDESAEVGQDSKISLVDEAENPGKNIPDDDTSETLDRNAVAVNEKSQEVNDYAEETIEYYSAGDFIGVTVEDMVAAVGEPEKIVRNLLGGGGRDTSYVYEGDDFFFVLIALYAPESNYNYDDRDAVINVAYVVEGALNDYVYTGMLYSELSSTYDLSEFNYFMGGNAILDGLYVASADNVTCNGYKCSLVAANSDGDYNSPLEIFIVTAKDLYN